MSERSLPDLGPPFHTGFVVADLDAAMAAWARLGTCWAEPIRSRGWWRAGDDVQKVSMGVVYTMATDHHIELVAPDGASLFGLGSTVAAHHVGYFVDDVPKVSAGLCVAGFPIALSRHSDRDDPIPSVAYHRVPGTSVHIELVGAWMRAVIEEWTTRGSFPRGVLPSVDTLDR